jgi:DIE2/ALG10 family
MLKLTGDRSNHTLSVNVPQIFYFYGFASGLGWPVLFFGGRGVTAGPMGLIRTFYYQTLSTTR